LQPSNISVQKGQRGTRKRIKLDDAHMGKKEETKENDHSKNGKRESIEVVRISAGKKERGIGGTIFVGSLQFLGMRGKGPKGDKSALLKVAVQTPWETEGGETLVPQFRKGGKTRKRPCLVPCMRPLNKRGGSGLQEFTDSRKGVRETVSDCLDDQGARGELSPGV